MTTILQLCPFSDSLEAALARRGTVIRWHELDDALRSAWLAEHASDVRVVATGGHIGCPTSLMTRLPKLALVAINGVGYDKVDLEVAHHHGVAVTTTPDVLTDDVADLAIGLVIALLRDLPRADRFVREGAWLAGNLPLGRRVSGRRFGIVGLGRIGKAIADRLAAFGPVAYSGTTAKPVPYAFHADAASLARDSDVLIVACAASPATQGLIDAAVLDALGPDGYLINIARGSVVDEVALSQALAEGRIAGAALDVYADEPRVTEALITSARTVLAPHIASATVETRSAMADLVIANIDALIAGQPLPTPVVAP
ncbi:2-hydroxyacid dehydrogenase [uncultured Sphingomonas sp.]|uniref:2-hydroxyacid dehydrogenase n=1 Tax=uncultured Sphingomonas sp. TaxID=158754 RepID=UPI003749053D